MTTWNMASARARNYKPRKYKPVEPIGPAIVEVQPGLFTVNGVGEFHEGDLGLLRDAQLDADGCSDCGYMVCGCERTCPTCGIDTARTPHDRATCGRTADDQLRSAIVAAYVHRITHIPDHATPEIVLRVLDDWAVATEHRSMLERTRAYQWLAARKDGVRGQQFMDNLRLWADLKREGCTDQQINDFLIARYHWPTTPRPKPDLKFTFPEQATASQIRALSEDIPF